MKPAQASATARVIAAATMLLAGDPRTAALERISNWCAGDAEGWRRRARREERRVASHTSDEQRRHAPPAAPQRSCTNSKSALVAPGAAALSRTLLSGNRVDRWLARSAVHPLTRALWRWVERLTLPGIMSHYWHRKRWIESRCRAAIAEGFERVVILGAGFDTLGLRLAREVRQIEVIEIDHPATQQAKQRALAGVPAAPADNLRFIVLDLGAAALPERLPRDGKATLFICEGVLMYLPPADVARLFDALRTLAGDRMRILFSFMTKWPDGRSGFRPHSWLIDRWLASRDEPFTWSLVPQAMQDFLAAHRFRLVEMALTPEFSEQTAGRTSTLEGENLVLCEPIRTV